MKKQPPIPSTDISNPDTDTSEPENTQDNEGNKIEPNEDEGQRDGISPQPPRPRIKLAPESLRCPDWVSNERIRRLLIEIQKLRIDETAHGRPLIAGIVMRVFLDLTVTYFLIKTNVDTPTGIESWDNYKARLPIKLRKALEVIDPSDLDRTLDNARTALNKDFHHSIHRLNEQIHALGAPILTQQECIQYWDRYAPLFDAIFKRLSEND